MLNYQRVYTVIHINDFLRKPGEVLLGRDSRESNGNHVFCLFESTTLPEHEMIWVRLFDHVRSGALFLALPGCACCDLLSWQQCTMSKLPSGVATVSSSDLQNLGRPESESPSRSWFEHLFSIWEAPKGWSCSELQSEIQPTLSPWWAIRIPWKCDTAFEEVKDIDYLVVKEDLRAYGEKSPSFLEKVSWRTSCTMLWFNLAFTLECLNKQNWACVQQKTMIYEMENGLWP